MVIFYVTYDAQQSNVNFGQSLRDTYILIDVHEKRCSRLKMLYEKEGPLYNLFTDWGINDTILRNN